MVSFVTSLIVVVWLIVEGRRLSTTTTMRYEEKQGGGTFTYETGQTTLINGRAVARVLATSLFSESLNGPTFVQLF